MTIADALAAGVIAVLSLRFGYGRLERRDWVALAVAALGIGVSQVLSSPLLALLVVIAVDASGFWLTVHKTWRAPHSETLISWALATVAGACGVVAVGKFDVVQLMYPIYIFVANGLLTVVIIARRPRVPHTTAEA
jgi:hypothetical protein